MNFTKRYEEYIYAELQEFVDLNFSVCFPKEIYDGNFSISLLEEEFEKYYNSKLKYISMYKYLKKEFSFYEKINLLSKKNEYKQYIQRFNFYVDKLKEDVKSKININFDIFNSDNDFQKKCKINFSSLKHNIDNVDFKLLALGKVNKKTYDFFKVIRLVYENCYSYIPYDICFKKEINKFLNTYSEYIEKNPKLLKNYNQTFRNFNQNYSYEVYVYLTHYDKINNDVVIDFIGEFDKTTTRLTFKDAIISEDINKYMKYPYILIDTIDTINNIYKDIGYYFDFKILVENEKYDICFEKRINITSKDLIIDKYYNIINFQKYNIYAQEKNELN